MLLIFSVWLPANIHLSADELPMFGEFPDPGKHWSKKDASGKSDGSYSWVNFDNAQSGDVLSFVAWKIKNPGIKVTNSPVRQASIETFTSDGYAAFSRRKIRGSPIADTIRNRFVSIYTKNHAADINFDTDAIEFSYIYENDREAPSTMAHGYVVVLGDLVLFVQHTSKHVITSEFAADMVFKLLWRHFKTISSIEKGWSAGINRSRVSSQ